jgi:hypothetical protein
VASRAESTILANMVEVPREEMEAAAGLELLRDILDEVQQIGPMLRKSIKKEANFDIDRLEKRINEIIRHEIEFDAIQ